MYGVFMFYIKHNEFVALGCLCSISNTLSLSRWSVYVLYQTQWVCRAGVFMFYIKHNEFVLKLDHKSLYST